MEPAVSVAGERSQPSVIFSGEMRRRSKTMGETAN